MEPCGQSVLPTIDQKRQSENGRFMCCYEKAGALEFRYTQAPTTF